MILFLHVKTTVDVHHNTTTPKDVNSASNAEEHALRPFLRIVCLCQEERESLAVLPYIHFTRSDSTRVLHSVSAKVAELVHRFQTLVGDTPRNVCPVEQLHMALHRPISLSFGLLLVLLNAVFGSTAVNPIFSSSASSALPPEFITADANLAFLEQAVMGGPGMVSVPASQWQAIKDFLAQPSSSLTTPTDAKLLLLTRHGQSTANVASSQV